jgi:hypothetical protein
MEPRQPGKLEQALALASVAVMTWCMMPPQERYWIQLRTAQFAHRVLGRLAWREGHKGMGDELAGGDPWPRYGAAYACSRARDLVGRALEAMRP